MILVDLARHPYANNRQARDSQVYVVVRHLFSIQGDANILRGGRNDIALVILNSRRFR